MNESHDLIPYEPLETLGRAADMVARSNRLALYKRGLSQETLRRQKSDIDLFTKYLNDAGISCGDVLNDITAWRGISFGLVEGFREWMLREGYAMQSVNVRLATVKKYAKIAFESDVIDASTFGLIQTVSGYYGKRARNVDEKRETKRVGAKKAETTIVSASHIEHMLDVIGKQDDFLARRDTLLLCLLFYQGLRCVEVHDVQRSDVDIVKGTFSLYRRKVDMVQKHRMHWRTMQAMKRYLASTNPQGLLFEGIDREAWTDGQGKMYKAHRREDGLSRRAINERVMYLGKEILGIEKLSPHDLRHAWTTDLFEQGTPIDRVKEAGGWKSYKMPFEYRNRSAIANEGVKQSE